MSWKNLLSFAVVSAFLANAAVADPTASLTGVANGGNFDWTLSFAADSGLFTNPADDNPDQGLGGSLATAFQIEVAAGGLVQDSWAIASGDFTGGLGSPLDGNPGIDPYNGGGVTEGVTDYASVASDLDSGTVDVIFVPLAGTFFTDGNMNAALTFTTSVNTVRAGGIVAQAGSEYTIAPFTGGPINTVLLGDVNLDTVVDALDIDPFVNRVLTGTFQAEADINIDTVVDALDIDPFVQILLGPGAGSLQAASVPEPSTMMILAGLSIAGLACARSRR